MIRLVSVLMPAYDGGPRLGDTIEVRTAPTQLRRGIIIVGDGSGDQTPARGAGLLLESEPILGISTPPTHQGTFEFYRESAQR